MLQLRHSRVILLAGNGPESRYTTAFVGGRCMVKLPWHERHDSTGGVMNLLKRCFPSLVSFQSVSLMSNANWQKEGQYRRKMSANCFTSVASNAIPSAARIFETKQNRRGSLSALDFMFIVTGTWSKAMRRRTTPANVSFVERSSNACSSVTFMSLVNIYNKSNDDNASRTSLHFSCAFTRSASQFSTILGRKDCAKRRLFMLKVKWWQSLYLTLYYLYRV